MKVPETTTALAVLLFTGGYVYGATYYVDYASGLDTNNGTSKSTPFKHAPGMNGCSNACTSTTPKAGDSVILKGGVTWPNASLGWMWSWSGNATTASPGCTGPGCIYVGVDQTWFSGGSWTRPVLNAGGATVSNGNTLLYLYANYVIIDNIEFTGVFWTGVPSYGSGSNIGLAGGSPGIGTNIQIQNIYIHGWSHGTTGAGTTDNACGVTGDSANPNNNVNSILINSVIDGSDTDQASCAGVFGSPPYVENSVIQYVSSAMVVDGPVQITGNSILHVVHSFDSNAHENAIESNYNQNLTIANNQIGHLGSGVLGIWCAPDVGYTCYIFNNVLFDTDVNNILDVASPLANNGCPNGGTYCNVAGAWALYNNTVECGPNSGPNAVCADNINAAMSSVAMENNHLITNATTPNNGIWSTNGVSPTVTTSLPQSLSAANAQGYSMTETFPFSPVAGGSTIGYGTNLTGLCSGVLTTLCYDSPVGVAYNTTAHTVSGPNRTALQRPPTGAWDAGAYKFGSSVPAPAPPSNLTTAVH